MAVRISCASGDFTAAATWATVDATSLLDSEAASTASTTSYVASSTFTPGAITIDGIAVKVALRSSTTGTMSVRLATGGVLVAGTEITINVADIDAGIAAAQNTQGWYLFKFAAPVLLLGSTAYTVDIKTSTNATVTLFRNATAGNWSRMLRTTTTGAPAAGDTLHVIGELTGAGTGTTHTVDMDSTASTDYGPGTDGVVALTVGKRGTLQYKYAASTNYYLKLSGNLVVYSGGTFTIGTVANPIPRTSTAVLEFDPVATGGMGLDIRGGCTVTMQGLSRSSGKNVPWCLLNADAAAAATSLTVDRDTGWLNGDEIVIASTSRTPGDSEGRTLNADAGATSLSVSAGLTNAHGGTAPVVAEVINLTRNVIVRSSDSSKMAWMNVGQGSSATAVTMDVDWVRFRYLGSGVTTNKGALSMNMPGGASGIDVQYCAYDGGTGWQLYSNPTTDFSFTFSNNVISFLASALTTAQAGISAGVGTWTMSGNAFIGANTGGRILSQSVKCTYTNNRIAGMSATAFYFAPTADELVGTVSGNVCHSCAVGGTLTGVYAGTFASNSIWRCATTTSITGCVGLVLTDLVMFGNGTINLTLGALADVRLVRPIICGDTSFATPRGIELGDSGRGKVVIVDGQIGVVSGIYVAHTTSDIRVNSGAAEPQVVLHNTQLASGVEIETQNNLWDDGYIGSQRHDGTAGSHKTFKRNGTISTDATAGLYRTSSPSERLTPSSASLKLSGGIKRFAVANGQTATVSVYVRESVVGDGTDYNGARARLVLKANPAAGVASDTVLATATVSSEGAFELISGTTPAVTDYAVLEVYVDCDGTTGWVNVDDWSVA